MTQWEETRLPCPCGKSSDAYAINIEGDGHCFSCGEHFFNKDKSTNMTILSGEDVVSDFYPQRGLSLSALEFYNVTTKFKNGEPKQTGYVYPNGAVKIRNLDSKSKSDRFFSSGPMSDATLFGMDKYDPGSRESITLTEGEVDALSIAQVTNFTTAACSIRSSSSARSDCIKTYDYINSFKKIYLCFDNDEAGISAMKSVSSLFDFKRVYIVKLSKYKDANGYLSNDEGQDLYKAWRGAKRYTPDNIISSFNEIEKSLEESKEDLIVTYPFKALNDNLWGMFRGEVIVFKGGEGIGKTEIFRAMEHHVLKTTKAPIGIIHLEEDNGTTVKAIATYELQQPVIIPDSVISNAEVLNAYKKAVSNDDSRVYIHSSFDVEDEEEFINNIRFLVSACGCEVIFLDHISWLATGGDNEDERKKLDRISQKLKLLAKELRFCLVMISHTNDDGKTRGSRNITKVGNTVIHMHRDTVAADINERRRTYLTIEKARLGGRTGPIGYVEFDTTTYTLKDTPDAPLS